MNQVAKSSYHLTESPKSILEQMADPHFPVPVDALKASISVLPINNGQIQLDELQVSTIAANHPGSCCAYQVDSTQGSFAYITDNELFPPYTPVTSYAKWIEFLRGVDLLVHDAMYLDEEAGLIHGWGHSLISQVLQLTVDAEIENTVLFHHDPSRKDRQLDEIHKNSQQWMAKQRPDSTIYVAQEGDVYHLHEHQTRLVR